jgi:thiamine pyrophosphate-dependent acetolactate synthase large subunit-like protein
VRLARAEAVARVLAPLADDDLVVTTTGMISREAFAARDRAATFYMLGSMGLASALALGLALGEPARRVVLLEGDGSALMALGTLAQIAVAAPANLVHVVLDNEAYESTGAQPSITARTDLAALARAAGYRAVVWAETADAVESAIRDAAPGPRFVLVKVAVAPVEGLPRVSRTPGEIRDAFRRAVGGGRRAV